MSLSLWLMPAREDAQRLGALLERCALATGSPRFLPHLTLCRDVPPPSNKLRRPLASELPVQLALSGPNFGHDYHHGAYLAATDGEALRDLQARCAAQLGAKVPQGYPLHVSLAYGLLDVVRQARVRLLGIAESQATTFDRLELWHTHGPVSDWHRYVRRASGAVPRSAPQPSVRSNGGSSVDSSRAR